MGKLEHLLQRAIRDPDVVLAVHPKTMRFQEAVLSPGGEQLARSSVETQNRGGGNDVCFVGCPGVLAPMEYKDVIVRIHGNTGDLAKDKSCRELRPAVHYGIRFGNIRSRHQRECIDDPEYYQEKDDARRGMAKHMATSEQREYSQA